MRAKRITANLRVADIEAAKSFYTGYLGLSTEEFNMGWVARYTSPETGVNVQLVTRDATAPEDSVISVHTDDVEAAYEEALDRATRSSIRSRPRVGVFADSLFVRRTATSSTSCITRTERST